MGGKLRRPAGADRRDETYSFGASPARINQYARWGLAQEIPRAATVALMMRNRPEYAAIWLGLTRIGAVVALIGPDSARPRAGACARRLRRAPRHRLARRRGGAARGGICRRRVWTFGPGERRLDARRRPLCRRGAG